MRSAVVVLLLLLPTALFAQARPTDRDWLRKTSRPSLEAAPAVRIAFPEPEVMLRQSTAGLVGGVAGAAAILLPLAANRRDGGVSDEAMTVGALLGYLGGATVAVKLYSDRRGMSGTWLGTFSGATIGMLGGPAFILTVPIGAMAGYNFTTQGTGDSEQGTVTIGY